MRFYLGSPDVRWLERADIPLFYAVDKFRTALPKAIAPWALDSGAYTELSKHGEWRITAKGYATRVREINRAVGMMDFACTQDWVCAPPVMEQTGLTVVEHQLRTVRSYLDLRDLAPEITWMPTLQGWAGPEYEEHVRMYAAHGVDLRWVPLVGIGSIASRQEDPVVGRVVRHLAGEGIKLHGFGVKKMGLKMYGDALASADSQAWSFDARFSFRVNPLKRMQRGGPVLPECQAEHLRGEHPGSCASCLRFAKWWRAHVLELIEAREELGGRDALFDVDHAFQESKRVELNTRQGARRVAATGTRNDPSENPPPEPLFPWE